MRKLYVSPEANVIATLDLTKTIAAEPISTPIEQMNVEETGDDQTTAF